MARALDSLHGRERVADMVRRRRERGERIPIALNADFFDLRTGTNENNQVIDGEVWKAVPVTDSPFDTFRNAHTQFAVDANGRPYLDRFSYAGSLDGTCGQFALDGVNGIPRLPDALVMFTGAYANAPLGDSLRQPAQLVLAGPHAQRGRGVGDVELTIVAAPGLGASGIPADRYVLGAYGTARARLDSIATRCGSARLRLSHTFRPDRGRLTMIVGGWPRVVVDGRNVAAAADSVEGTFPRFSAQRHPRSAVGFSRDSGVVYLVAVDGRQEASAGMTLAELADFLVSIGVFQGLNLDGGGSTTLVIDGRIVNHPSDAAGERAVGNAILVRER
jgi:Phosphodiester glycosidase